MFIFLEFLFILLKYNDKIFNIQNIHNLYLGLVHLGSYVDYRLLLLQTYNEIFEIISLNSTFFYQLINLKHWKF